MSKPQEKPTPSYFEMVYAVARKIPPGRVTNYGSIASYLALGAARMVGWAMNHVQPEDRVPAHRVVNRKGELSGRHHFRPPERMAQLLESEGVAIVDDAVRDFDKLFWDPGTELPLEALDD